MLLQYSAYLAKAVVSAMVAVFMVFVKNDTYISTKYRYANTGIALVALLDMCMDIWGCWMTAEGMNGFNYHWVWAGVYYLEWTVLGICVLKLVDSRHTFYWFPPLLIWYVLTDSKRYQTHVDDNYAGTQNENLHELAYYSPTFYVIYLVLTVIDLIIMDNCLLDTILVIFSTLAVVWIIVCIFNLQPSYAGSPLYIADRSEESGNDASTDTGNIESRVKAWETREDKPYCRESVSLIKVADELRVSPRVLSSYINSVRMLNFNAWINTLRVEEIKRTIRENPNVDTYDLMVDSGFQSRSSLSRAVKAATGMTITQLKSIGK